MKTFIITFFFLIIPFTFYAQLTTKYAVDAELEIENKLIRINQKLSIKNIDHHDLDTLFFNDWTHSYSNSNTPLAQKFAEEFDRSFYISSKKSRGRTKINSIFLNNEPIEWDRLNNQDDILYTILPNRLKSFDSISFNINYEVTIPDKQFTGYGFNKNFIYLKDFIISLSPFNYGKWIIQSNLNLNDNSLNKSEYFFRWKYPKNFHLLSSMDKLNSYSKENFKVANYFKTYERSPKFIFSKENKIREYNSNGSKILTDIFEKSDDLAHLKIDRIHNFLLNNLSSTQSNNSYLITSFDYDQRPLYGLNLFPKILSPFDQVFIEELKFLKTFSSEYIRSQLSNFNFRENHWLSEGLTIYFLMKYIELYHPKQMFIGKFSKVPFIKNYHLSKLSFNKSFTLYSELMLRRSLHQKANTPNNLLIKFNERISTPYQVGVLLTYLENYIGKSSFNSILKNFHKIKNIEDLIFIVNQNTSKKGSDNLIKYLNSKHTLDIKITKVIKLNNGISVSTDQVSNESIPYEVALIKDNNVIESKWAHGNSNTIFNIKNDYADYVAINPNIELPEINKRNNWRSLNSKFLNKPLSLKLFKDSEDPSKNQLLINPNAFYNLYDGAAFGAKFHNKTLQRRPFVFILQPSYSTIEKTLVGSVMTDFRYYNDSRSNFLTQLSFFGSSFHYAPNSLYKIAVPTLNFHFRPVDLRSNLRHVIGFSWYSIQRESLSIRNSTPNYSIGELKYKFSNKGSVKFMTLENSFEFAKNFKKLIFEMQYRKLFKSGRLLSSRLFFGTFLQNNIDNSTYFNFNLNKPNDYLFEYAYFGRSETEGFFSQQFILNEGGFKSIIPNTSSNQWLLSANFSVGVWRWIESYVDLAILKNQFNKHQSYYDYGLKINLIPDYFELYFPAGSSQEYSINKEKYFSKIRFVLSLNTKDISTFFTRRWF